MRPRLCLVSCSPTWGSPGAREAAVNQSIDRSVLERCCSAVVEELEHRRLLSTSLVNGILRINGTSGADVITVKTSGTTGLRVSDNGIVNRFDVRTVRTIVVFGGAGNDNLQIANDVV